MKIFSKNSAVTNDSNKVRGIVILSSSYGSYALLSEGSAARRLLNSEVTCSTVKIMNVFEQVNNFSVSSDVVESLLTVFFNRLLEHH